MNNSTNVADFKSMIGAKMILHSKHANFPTLDIATMEVTFPRYILAELNTHRIFSRNSASSRAIPFKKMVQSVMENPYIPIAWQKDHSGMQGTEYITDAETINLLRYHWLKARDEAVDRAISMNELGATKQMLNRLLEPFMYHTALITSTEWKNFIKLRCPQYEYQTGVGKKAYSKSWKEYVKVSIEMGLATEHDYTDHDATWKLQFNKGQADIHIMALAEAMYDCLKESIPQILSAGEWHIPYISDLNANGTELWGKDVMEFVKVATARCARVSYTVAGTDAKEHSVEKDIELHDRLSKSGHWSPFEHCARAMDQHEYYKSVKGEFTNYTLAPVNSCTIVCNSEAPIFGHSGNLRGFVQYRKMFAGEAGTE